jgi:hypothetical protein
MMAHTHNQETLAGGSGIKNQTWAKTRLYLQNNHSKKG